MQTFEVNIDELGVSQLYLNQRKLEAVREKTMAEDFAGFEPLPVYDFGDGRKVLTDGHSRAFVAQQKGQKTIKVYWDNDPNTTGKLRLDNIGPDGHRIIKKDSPGWYGRYCNRDNLFHGTPRFQ